MAAAMEARENGRSGSVAGFGAVRPQLFVDAPRALDALHFYKRAFAAQELKRAYHPKRKADQEHPLILHSLLLIGSSAQILVSDDTTQDSAQDIVKSPATLKGTSMILELETDDLEAAMAMAVEAGATVVEEVTEKPWGRSAKILDPFGFVWGLFTPVRVPEEGEEEDEDNEEEEEEEEEAEEGEEGVAAVQDE